MGKYQKFDEVPVWQEAARLYQRVLDLLEEPNVPFSATFRNQLERAGLCVSNSVAEGIEGHANDMLPYLQTARGAAAEVQSMIAVIWDRPKVVRLSDPLQQIRASAESCARQLGAWKYSIENPGQKRQSTTGQAAAPPTGSRPPSAAPAPTPSAAPSPGPNRAGR